jgi:formylglycine-generating enzyme required for sulfatase activity
LNQVDSDMRLIFLWALMALIAPASGMAEPFDMFRDCDECPEMIELPLGEFMMGAPEGESKLKIFWYEGAFRHATADHPYIAYQEGPVHRVQIDVPIAMGRNEVTYDEWMACVDDGDCSGYIPDPEVFFPVNRGLPRSMMSTGSHPVINVSYLDALNYTAWLNTKVGVDVYRLPTEAEWEYAARAGSQTPFAQGEEVTTDQVNYGDVESPELYNFSEADFISRWVPVPVEALNAANSWGFRHMSGNVSEITMSCWSERHEDWMLSSIYLAQAYADERCRRVTRGGRYDSYMDQVRVAVRGSARIDVRLRGAGFRVLREISE